MLRGYALIGFGLSAVIGYLLGKKGLDSHHGNADATLFTTQPGDHGFCKGKVLKFRMKGRAFHWRRVGQCRPSSGGYFEIRMKQGVSPLIPARPQGVNDIYADVHAWAKPFDVYEYSLWQVMADGRERELHDPELEIGQ